MDEDTPVRQPERKPSPVQVGHERCAGGKLSLDYIVGFMPEPGEVHVRQQPRRRRAYRHLSQRFVRLQRTRDSGKVRRGITYHRPQHGVGWPGNGVRADRSHRPSRLDRRRLQRNEFAQSRDIGLRCFEPTGIAPRTSGCTQHDQRTGGKNTHDLLHSRLFTRRLSSGWPGMSRARPTIRRVARVSHKSHCCMPSACTRIEPSQRTFRRATFRISLKIEAPCTSYCKALSVDIAFLDRVTCRSGSTQAAAGIPGSVGVSISGRWPTALPD